jgi:chromosome segregation ATPase
VITLEAEKKDFINEIESLKLNYKNISNKYDQSLDEIKKAIDEKVYIKDTNELKNQLNDLKSFHKHELAQTINKIETIQKEKTDLSLKYSQLSNEIRRLKAENQVLDNALNEGIGKKVQSQIIQLQKSIELYEIQNKDLSQENATIKAEMIQLKEEKDKFKNLSKSNEITANKNKNKLIEANYKVAKLEDKLETFKQKTTNRISDIIDRNNSRDSEINLIKLEYDKKIADLLLLMEKKQSEIDELSTDKRLMEAQLDLVWQAASNENQKMKQNLLDFKLRTNDPYNNNHYKLLLDD